tara:strand:- start:919 stop:2952 length:2034 start_codon:yes stop_codon:yes gene_type:complete
MKDFNILIYYNKLALSDEDNQFVSHYLEEGCKITAQDIHEKYNSKFNVKIDYLCLEKGDAGIKQLYDKLDTYNDLIFTHAHVITKYQPQILKHLSHKKSFFFHLSPPTNLKNDINKNMFCLAKTGKGINLALLNNVIENHMNTKIYHLHNGLRNASKVIEKYSKLDNYNSFLLEGVDQKISDQQHEYIQSEIEKIFVDLKPDELIILDVGFKYLKVVFALLDDRGLKNKVISMFGTLTGRFEKVSFDLLSIGGYSLVSSLSNLDLMNKVYPEELTNAKRALLDTATWRLEIPLLISEALNKCRVIDLKTQNEDAIKSALLSFDGQKDIFLGRRNDFSFDKDGVNQTQETLGFVYPNSVQVKKFDVPKILYKHQFDANLKKKSVIYSYIDIERVFNVGIQAGTWTAEFYIDIISDLDDPINEIIFNNLNPINDKFSYKFVFEKKEQGSYSTKRYYVVAIFDFLPFADNFPFDWQNIYIAQTLKNKDKYILQPIPEELIDQEFDIAEWSIVNSFSGIKYKKNKLYEGTDLDRTVEISNENRVGWILKRKNTATLLKIGIPLFFLIYLVYYSTFIEFEYAYRSISILTTTFLSAIALYFSVEKPEPKKLTIVDLIFIWFYLINGITILAYGSASFIGLEIFYWVVLMLKIAIPLSLIMLSYHLYERIKRNRESIMLDRDV